MKRSLDAVEWYPVYLLCDPHGQYPDEKLVEFTNDELADLKRVEVEFAMWQEKIRERFGA